MKFPTGKAPSEIKVTLVVPNYSDRISNVAQTTVGPPLGLAYIAAVLAEREFEVSILDANAFGLSDAETVTGIAESAPDVVGFTSVTPTADQCGRLVKLVKTAIPDCMTVMGGIHPTAVPEDTIDRYDGLDLVVRGEADTRFANLLKGLASDKTFGDFEGVAFRDNGNVSHLPLAMNLENLDELPFPARHMLPMERYIGPDGDGFTTIVGARGCPGRCIYCSVNQSFGGRLRNRSPRLVVEEMVRCHEQFGTRTYAFVDDTFTTNRKWVEELCDCMTDAGVPEKMRWFCLTRVDKVDRELLLAMKKAGCFKVEFGIESGHQDVLDYLGKGTTTDQVLRAFSMAKEIGLKTFAFVMLFSPAETKDSLQATKDLVFKADPDYLQASFCTPYPGTDLADDLKRKGLDVSDDWSKFVFLTGPVIKHPDFSYDQMISWQKHLLRSFYFRPKIIWRMLKNVLAGGNLRGFIRTAFSAVGALMGKGRK